MEKALNPIEAMYEQKPRRWVVYTLVVLCAVIMLGWSANAIKFKGLASRGSDVAYGILHGITHPDTTLLFDLSKEGVPYMLFETIAIVLTSLMLIALGHDLFHSGTVSVVVSVLVGRFTVGGFIENGFHSTRLA